MYKESSPTWGYGAFRIAKRAFPYFPFEAKSQIFFCKIFNNIQIQEGSSPFRTMVLETFTSKKFYIFYI